VEVFNHRHYIHRLQIPAYVAGKICTVVILGLPTAELVRLRWGRLLVNLYINLKSIFMTLSLPIYLISMALTHNPLILSQPDAMNTITVQMRVKRLTFD